MYNVHVCTRPVCYIPLTLLATLVNNILKYITRDYIFAQFALIETRASAIPPFSFACFCFWQSLSNDQMLLAQTQYCTIYVHPATLSPLPNFW